MIFEIDKLIKNGKRKTKKERRKLSKIKNQVEKIHLDIDNKMKRRRQIIEEGKTITPLSIIEHQNYYELPYHFNFEIFDCYGNFNPAGRTKFPYDTSSKWYELNRLILKGYYYPLMRKFDCKVGHNFDTKQNN